jgi:hypothetical protein
MHSNKYVSAAAVALLMAFVACDKDPIEVNGGSATTNRQYGPTQSLGGGTVRSYITLDSKNSNVPVEIGVAISETAMDNLPAAAPAMSSMPDHSAHANMAMAMNMYLLDLPSQNPTPYKFVQFDWNPSGHEPAGVYDLPHFDFHFYTVPVSVRNSIVPTDPQYAAKAANYPAQDLRAPFYIDAATPAGAPPAAVTVPEMGLHWLDVRSPELQGMAGKPQDFKAFTKTFIYGSWNGEFIFDEPMITKAYLLAKKTTTDATLRDELIPVSTPTKRAKAGYYPNAYRITYDASAKEYRVALTQLVLR